MAPPPVERQPTQSLPREDWVAVLVGSAIILLVLAGVRPDAPRFGWSAAADLPTTIFAASNVSRWLQLGLLLLAPAAAGARLMGVRVVPFVIGFAVLYGLAWVSQVLAGFAGSSGLGLEYVIYALGIGLLLGHTTPLRRRFAEAVQAEYPHVAIAADTPQIDTADDSIGCRECPTPSRARGCAGMAATP
jgi:hypothetical protein